MRAIRRTFLILACAWAVFAHSASAQTCPRCKWAPPSSGEDNARYVGSVEDLRKVLAEVSPNTTIFLRSGAYPLDRMLDIPVPGVTLRGLSGDPESVVIHGDGPEESTVGVALSIGAKDVTIADLTIADVGFHGIQVRGESMADGVVLHNIRIRDTGQQLVKGSASNEGRGPNNGLVACSEFSYTDHAPNNYTNAVDILGGTGWTVRDNTFERIRGTPAENYACGPAILFWRGCRDTIVENNRLRDCFRGISLGLGPPKGRLTHDHFGGVIRQNTLSNAHDWADEGIEANSADGVLIENNTVDVTGRMPWSISVRFPESSARVVNNKIARVVMARDGATLEQRGNVLLEPENDLLNYAIKLAKLLGFVAIGALLALLPFRLRPGAAIAAALIVSTGAQAARFYFERTFPTPLSFAVGAFAVLAGWWIVASLRHPHRQPRSSAVSNLGARRSTGIVAGLLAYVTSLPLLRLFSGTPPRGHVLHSAHGSPGYTTLSTQPASGPRLLRQAVRLFDAAPHGLKLTLVFVTSIVIMVATVLAMRSL